MVDRVGEQLGNYRLICLLGQGGFADVYLGEHVYLKTLAAIKLLQARLVNEELEAFLAEARTIAGLVHPHIVRVLDFGIEGDTPFLVMEYAPNGTLRQRHPKGSFVPMEEIVAYVKQVATALQYAHDRKLIHRDVKPENMLLGVNNEILLSDFGLALVTLSSRHQNTQEAVGTMAYMAPEQLQGKPRLASDQYALGIVVYEWFTGERPFQGSFTEVASQHMLVTPPPLHERLPMLPPAVEHVIQIALAKDPHQRFASIRLFATALEQAYQPLLSRQGAAFPANQPLQPSALPTKTDPTTQSTFVTSPTLPGQISQSPEMLPPPGESNHGPEAWPTPAYMTPLPDQSPVALAAQKSPPSYVTPLPDLPTDVQRGQGVLPSVAASPRRQATRPYPKVQSSNGALSPSSVTLADEPVASAAPIQPSYKKKTSRRRLVFGLTGLAALAALGGGVALLMETLQTPTTTIVPTQAPTSNPTLAPIVNVTDVPTSKTKPKHKHTPTPTDVDTPTPTLMPTATPSPRPTATPTPTPMPTPTPTPPPLVSSGEGTLYHGKSFNFNSGNQVNTGGDVYWHQHTSVVRTLDPKGSAKLANMGVIDFANVTYQQLVGLSYSTTPIDGNDDSTNQLATGDVFAVLTNDGNHAKVQVTGYGYDLAIKWVTYKG